MLVWFGWLLSIFCIEGTIFSAWIFYIPGRPYDALTAAFYGAFHRMVWSLGTSWMIFAMSTGNGCKFFILIKGIIIIIFYSIHRANFFMATGHHPESPRLLCLPMPRRSSIIQRSHSTNPLLRIDFQSSLAITRWHQFIIFPSFGIDANFRVADSPVGKIATTQWNPSRS